ncbi:MAG: hypothetical protein ABIP94_09290, partial [Planctomycetota bacterium]
MTRLSFSSSLAPVLSLLVAAGPIAAQCTTQWLPGDGAPGVLGGSVAASTMWDPDGAGPLAPVLVVAGTFTLAGKVAANRVATYDPGTGVWAPLGLGMGAAVNAVVALSNGDLVAGGDFTMAGGVSANRIARWRGGAWSPIGVGMDASVRALVELNTGDLVAGGSFLMAGGAAASYIASWNGTVWSPVGTGTNNVVRAL